MNPLPEEVKRFLETNIDSVDQLEILRVLGEDPDKEWPAVDLAREVQSAPQSINAHLNALHARGFLLVDKRESDLFCRYGPHSPDLVGRTAQLLQVYRERPVTMIKLVYATARDPLKTFADAFRLKKEG
ncbi:MAG TPA: hypothetical protein VH592_25850 [Gemmataceae bacterium]